MTGNRIRIDSRAAEELAGAADWYEREKAGLGNAFIDAFENALELLKEDPTPLLPIVGRASELGAKRLLLHKFPYSIVVLPKDDELVIVALAHHSRRPGYWEERLST